MSNGNNQRPYSFGDISRRYKNYIEKEKPGLQRFYKFNTDDEFDQYLKDPVTRGLAMTKHLMNNQCPREESAALSLLALWDLVVLIDNSISMGIDEDGARVKTLTDTLKAASTVYSFAEAKGITAIRFLNSTNKYTNVTSKKINALMKKVVFEGLTNIGTKLRDKVLVNHVTPDMKRPVLVIILTDAEIEGEATGLLRDVIVSQAVELREAHGDHGPDVVAYQFAKIGNDEAGKYLLGALDDDEILGDYIDCMGDDHRLEDLLGNMWKILPKLLLGAISPYWDRENATSEVKLENKDEQLKARASDDDEDLEEDDEDEEINILTGDLKLGSNDKTESNSAAEVFASNDKTETPPTETPLTEGPGPRSDLPHLAERPGNPEGPLPREVTA